MTHKEKKQNQKALDGCNTGNTLSTGMVCSTCPKDFLINPFHYYLAGTSPQDTVIKIKILLPWMKMASPPNLQARWVICQSQNMIWSSLYQRGQDVLQAIYSPVKSTTWLKHNYKTGWFYLQRQGSKSSLAWSGHHCTIIPIIFPDTLHWRGWREEQRCKTM